MTEMRSFEVNSFTQQNILEFTRKGPAATDQLDWRGVG